MDTISSKKKKKKSINFPAKKKIIKDQTTIKNKKEENCYKSYPKKKKKVKKKTGPSIYSKEYLEKKHGIKIDENFQKHQKIN